MESYVLDKTFKSIGSIGTGISVRLGASSPTASKYRNYVKTLAGTLTKGTVLGVGISVTGCSETGKDVIVRLVGIAKAKLRATQGSIIQGKPMFAATGGKLQSAESFSKAGNSGTAYAIMGQCVEAEGGGSANGFISLKVQPQYI